MKKINISSTELKRKTAQILNMVGFGKTIAVVERYGSPLVKIIPASLEKEKKADLEKKAGKYFGAIPNLSSVSKKRYFKKRNIKL